MVNVAGSSEERPKCSRCQTPMRRYNIPGTGDRQQAWKLDCLCVHSTVPDVARTSNLMDEHGRPYHPDMELSWQTYLGNNGQQQPAEVRRAYIAAWYAAHAYAAGWPDRQSSETSEQLRVRLAKDIYDDGQDHHPPSYVGRKGDVVVIHSIQTAVVSHRGTGDGFVVHDGELELNSSEKASEGPG